MESILTLKVQRFDPQRDPPRWAETFQIQRWGKMNLLEALLRIQEEIDGSLCFRYSCRGAVCGSCAMRVNGQVVLACRTPVESLVGRRVLIEPLPNFPVIRDLIVDMSTFFKRYREIQPYLHSGHVESSSENRMSEDERKTIDPYINCILCGICYGVCPAFGRDPRFFGPAVLAKAYRFLADPRDKRGKDFLEAVDSQRGVWGCNTVFQCVRICPKEVPPTLGIVKMRRKLFGHRVASFFPRLSSLVSRLF